MVMAKLQRRMAWVASVVALGGTTTCSADDDGGGAAGGSGAASPVPTCDDGLQNQGETGIDCGGPCPRSCCVPEPVETTCEDASCGLATNNCDESVSCGTCADGMSCTDGQCALPGLAVSSDGHGLQTQDGQPFLFLADTAWELFRMTTREEATQYLAARKAQGFTVVMACSHGVEDSPYDIDTPNRYGHVAFVDSDFATPQVLDGADNDYWDHVDFVIDEAARIGLYVAFLPYWARDYAVSYSCSGACVDETTGRALGQFFGARYGDRDHLIWVIGGDNNAFGEEEVMRATAAGIAEGAGRDQDELLMTYHPNGWGTDPHSSSAYFHDDGWLDCNGVQSGHYLDVYNYLLIAADYALSPPKPTLELEAVYEHIYDHFDPANHRFDDYDTRSKGYWALFAGAAGYTYGNNAVWQFYREGLEPRYYLEPDRYWYDEIDKPSAQQMLHLRNLCTSRPLGGRFPDQSLIVEGEGAEQTFAVATRGADQSYAMVYLPTPRPITVRLDLLSGQTTRAWWFDPRDGSCSAPVEVVNTGQSQQFTPPASPVADWVLVLDDAAAGYGPPGSP